MFRIVEGFGVKSIKKIGIFTAESQSPQREDRKYIRVSANQSAGYQWIRTSGTKTESGK